MITLLASLFVESFIKERFYRFIRAWFRVWIYEATQAHSHHHLSHSGVLNQVNQVNKHGSDKHQPTIKPPQRQWQWQQPTAISLESIQEIWNGFLRIDWIWLTRQLRRYPARCSLARIQVGVGFANIHTPHRGLLCFQPGPNNNKRHMLSVPVGWCRILRSSISSIFPLRPRPRLSYPSLWYNNEDDDEETKHIDNPPTTLPWHAAASTRWLPVYMRSQEEIQDRQTDKKLSSGSITTFSRKVLVAESHIYTIRTKPGISSSACRARTWEVKPENKWIQYECDCVVPLFEDHDVDDDATGGALWVSAWLRASYPMCVSIRLPNSSTKEQGKRLSRYRYQQSLDCVTSIQEEKKISPHHLPIIFYQLTSNSNSSSSQHPNRRTAVGNHFQMIAFWHILNRFGRFRLHYRTPRTAAFPETTIGNGDLILSLFPSLLWSLGWFVFFFTFSSPPDKRTRKFQLKLMIVTRTALELVGCRTECVIFDFITVLPLAHGRWAARMLASRRSKWSKNLAWSARGSAFVNKQTLGPIWCLERLK